MSKFYVALAKEFENVKSFHVKGKIFVNLNYEKSSEGEEIQINTIDLQFKDVNLHKKISPLGLVFIF